MPHAPVSVRRGQCTKLKMLSLIIGCYAAAVSAQSVKSNSVVTAFTNVNVISMENEKILTNQTVLIKDNVIRKIGTNLPVPKKAVKIKGDGKFLMPGMMDSHPHMPDEKEISHRKYFLMNLMAGVTSLRLMRGNSRQLILRDSIRKGVLLGPQLFVSTPPIGYQVRITAHHIRDSIRGFKKKGYDFIKLISNDTTLCDSIIKISHFYNLKVAGHVAKDDLSKAIRNKQNSIEHIEALVKFFNSDSVNLEKSMCLIHSNTIYLCPDIYWYYTYWKKIPAGKFENSDGIGLIPELVKEWKEYMEKYNISDSLSVIHTKNIKIAGEAFRLAEKKDVKILAGAGEGLYIVPGFALHKELEALVGMGLKPYTALRSATSNGAAFFDKEKSFGTIREGSRADMVLLNKNPIENISHIKYVEGVMVNGSWFTIPQLQKLLPKN